MVVARFLFFLASWSRVRSKGGDSVGFLFLPFFLNGTEFDTVSKSCITEFGFQIWV